MVNQVEEIVKVGLIVCLGTIMVIVCATHTVLTNKPRWNKMLVAAVAVVIAVCVVVSGFYVMRVPLKYLGLSERSEELWRYVTKLDETGYGGLSHAQRVEIIDKIYDLNDELLEFEDEMHRCILLNGAERVRPVMIPPSLQMAVEEDT